MHSRERLAWSLVGLLALLGCEASGKAPVTKGPDGQCVCATTYNEQEYATELDKSLGSREAGVGFLWDSTTEVWRQPRSDWFSRMDPKPTSDKHDLQTCPRAKFHKLYWESGTHRNRAKHWTEVYQQMLKEQDEARRVDRARKAAEREAEIKRRLEGAPAGS